MTSVRAVAVFVGLLILQHVSISSQMYNNQRDSSSVENENSREYNGEGNFRLRESPEFQPFNVPLGRIANRRETPALDSSSGTTGRRQVLGGSSSTYTPTYLEALPHRVYAAVRNNVRRVSSIVVQNIPYVFTPISSTVFEPNRSPSSGQNTNRNTDDQSDMNPYASSVLYPSSGNSGSSHTILKNSNDKFPIPSLKPFPPGSNKFPVVVVPSQQNPAKPQLPFASSGSSVGIPVASGGVKPPSHYVPEDQSFVLDFGAIPTSNPSNRPQSQNNFENGPANNNNNFPSHNFANPSRFPNNQFQPPIQSGGSAVDTIHSNTNNFPVGSNQQGNQQPPLQSSNGFGGSNNFGPQPVPSNNFGASASGPTNTALFDVVDGIQIFALDLLSTFRKMQGSGNIIFSPVSITSLLSLLTLGSRGISKHEIEVALSLPNSHSSMVYHQQYEQILRRLNHVSQGINISTSSRLFMEQDIPVEGTFTQQASDHYNCTVSLENFSKRPQPTMRRVNRWVAEATQGKITQFITEPFRPETIFVAANTIYFNGEWETPFPKYFTAEKDFNTGLNTIKVPMMLNIFETPHYYNANINADIVSIPYKGGEFAMFIVLPRESPQEKSIELFETQLDTYLIEQMISSMTIKSVAISLPKMKMAMKSSLVNSLGQLNIQSIFSPVTADFRKLTSHRPVWVSAFLHEAIMEVNEVGTVAAAVSGTSMDRIGGYQVVNVNKPAIIFIRDLVTGLPLFWTRLVKPESLS